FAFNIDVPKGATSIDVDLSYLSPTGERAFTAGPSATANLAVIAWNTLLLFPPGKPADNITVEGSIKFPEGWTTASALIPNSETATQIDYKPASLTTYIDSPVLIGRYLKKVAIPSGTAPQHRID